MQIEIFKLFPTPFLRIKNVLSNEECELISNYIRVNGDWNKDPALCQLTKTTYDQSKINLMIDDISKNVKGLENFKVRIQSLVDEYHKIVGTYKSNIEISWASISSPGSKLFHHYHLHNGVAGVIYIKVDSESRSLKLYNPTKITYNIQTETPFVNNIHNIQPVQGEVLLFPGELQHGGPDENKSEERIIISFDAPYLDEDGKRIRY